MTCTWSGSWCARLMRCWPALLFHFFRKSGFWVACQVLFAKILTNFMSALFIRRCWCFGPRPAGQSIFATTAFSQLMMLLSEREDLQRRWTFWPNQFFFLFIFYFKVGHFFSPVCSVRNMYYNRKNILFYNKKKNHINSLQNEEKERKEPKWWQEFFLICYSWVVRASDLSPFIKFLHCHS